MFLAQLGYKGYIRGNMRRRRVATKVAVYVEVEVGEFTGRICSCEWD